MDARDTETRTILCWLALARLPGLGARRIARLLELLDSPCAVFAAAPELRERLGPEHPALAALAQGPDTPATRADLAWAGAPGHHLLTLGEARYPPLLRQLPDPPPVLFVHGDPAALGTAQVAVVGSRNPSPSGREIGQALAHELAAQGLNITSGLALGIDSAAHRGALAAGAMTVAVLGSGPDVIYPPTNAPLAHAIAARGAVVSEFPPGTRPRRGHFPRRNRLISGLALGTVVVEAAARSGSLITAYAALEQGREVFAVPGPVSSPLSRGCHRLIREGATLVESAADVLEQLPGPWQAASSSAHRGGTCARADTHALPPALARVFAHLDFTPAAFDTLLARSGADAAQLSAALMQLELQGLAATCEGNTWVRTGAGAGA